MDDLVAFLQARLDDDDADTGAVHDATCAVITLREPPCDCGWPERMRRDIAAKRHTLDLYEDQAAKAGENAEDESRSWLLAGIVLDLATVYADHPDYQPGWSPEDQAAPLQNT